MHTGSFLFPAGGPDISAVILNDLFHNGKPDAAASLGGIAGGIRAVKPLEYFPQIFFFY